MKLKILLKLSDFIEKNWFTKVVISNISNLFFFIIRKYKTNLYNNYDKILIVSLHKLGDSVFAIPAIKEIIEYHKNNIALVCFPETQDIYELILINVEYKHIPHKYFYLNEMFAGRKARKIIKNIEPKTIYDLTGSITSASLIFNSKAKEIIGINKETYKNIYTNFSAIRKKPHVVDIYLDAIKATIPYAKKNILNLPNEIKKDGYVLIHPFAGWKAKQWNLKKFLELGEKLNKEYPCLFVFPSGSNTEDIIEELKRKNIPFIETKTVKELIKVIQGSSAFIGNDSGPIHIANLLDKPTFTIYGPTNPEYHVPLTGVNEYIIHRLKCSPKPDEKVCFTNGGRFGCPAFECMNNLGVDDVLNKLKSFFKKINFDLIN